MRGTLLFGTIEDASYYVSSNSPGTESAAMARGSQLEALIEQNDWEKVRKGLGRIKARKTIHDLLYEILARAPGDVPIDIVETLLSKLPNGRPAVDHAFSNSATGDPSWPRMCIVHSMDLLRLVLTNQLETRSYYRKEEEIYAARAGFQAIWKKYLLPHRDIGVWQSYSYGRGSGRGETPTEDACDSRERELLTVNRIEDASEELKDAWERTKLLVGYFSAKAKLRKELDASQAHAPINGGTWAEVSEKERAAYASASIECGTGTVLHQLVEWQAPPAAIRLALQLYPDQNLKRDDSECIPLHYAIRGFTGMAPTDIVKFASVPTMSVMKLLLATDPSAASFHDTRGCTPLILLTEMCVEYKYISRNDILDVVHAEPRSLITRDTVTHMLPFMFLASRMEYSNPDNKMKRTFSRHYAASGKTSFDILYTLIRENPNAVSSGIKATAYELYLEAKLRKMEARIAALEQSEDAVGSKRARQT